MKKSLWFERDDHPHRVGFYECVTRLPGLPGIAYKWGLLEWDGWGFKVPMPMAVLRWRGLYHEPK